MVEGASVAFSPAVSSPSVFQASVARWKSRKPRRVASSSAASGGSGRPWSSMVTGGKPARRGGSVRARPGGVGRVAVGVQGAAAGRLQQRARAAVPPADGGDELGEHLVATVERRPVEQ